MREVDSANPTPSSIGYSKRDLLPLPHNDSLDVTAFISSQAHHVKVTFIDAATGHQLSFLQLWRGWPPPSPTWASGRATWQSCRSAFGHVAAFNFVDEDYSFCSDFVPQTEIEKEGETHALCKRNMHIYIYISSRVMWLMIIGKLFPAHSHISQHLKSRWQSVRLLT